MTLKEVGNAFKDIYVRKDVHPQVNNEFRRLKVVEKQEREKPENQGCTVVYNAIMHTILVVIDRFKPNLFWTLE